MFDISASIVLYNHNKEQIKKVIDSFFNTSLEVKLYLVDNSDANILEELKGEYENIEYIYNNKNLGYGSAHNIAIRQSINENIRYHIVLNPDIYFDNDVLIKLYGYMQNNKNVGNIMPKILYPNHKIQYLCKLLPSPQDLLLRRFNIFKKYQYNRNKIYELRFSGYKDIMNIPSLSGCFMFLRNSALKEVGLFDKRFFMYLEDVDLNRRIHIQYKTIFYPEVIIYHDYQKGSYKSKKLLMYHILSAIYYFTKWGWIFDKQRDKINTQVLKSLNYKKELRK